MRQHTCQTCPFTITSLPRRLLFLFLTGSLRLLLTHKSISLSNSCSFTPQDGNQIFSVGADKAGRMYDVNTQQSTQVAAHDAPIKCCRMVDPPGGSSLLATGSWDKTVKVRISLPPSLCRFPRAPRLILSLSFSRLFLFSQFWDLRQQNAVATTQLPERIYAMDVHYPHLIVGTADRTIQAFDLSRNPTEAIVNITSPLKYQTRSIGCFIKGDANGGRGFPGYAVGSIEGRVGIQYIYPEDKP